MTPRRTPHRIALAGVLTLTTFALAGQAPATAARGVERLHVPHHATHTIDGRGYGHGHGLSQYGAEGAARKGLTARQIVSFYYPHTRQGQATDLVRVLISADTDDNTTVVAGAGLEVHSLRGGPTTPVPTRGRAARATRWRLSAGSRGATEVSYRTDSWHVWKRLDGDAEFKGRKALTLVVGTHTVSYRGSLQSRTPVGGPPHHRVTVNRLPLDAYVKAVVPNEMPALWHQAALRAQAIAARTYAAYEVSHSANPVYQLCDTSLCQVYGGRSSEYPTTNKAVAATAGQVRTYHGSPAFTQFSASDGGRTSASGEPYLIAQKDPYDGWSGNAVHTWSTSVTSHTIESKWPALGNLTGIAVSKRDGKGQWGGRVESLTLHGSHGDVKLSGDSFRLTLGLRSTWFNLTV
jgi:SpoIID/LytB domain protein